jgi:hypothetical protein
MNFHSVRQARLPILYVGCVFKGPKTNEGKKQQGDSRKSKMRCTEQARVTSQEKMLT